MIRAPKTDEFADFYKTYVSLVPEADLLETLQNAPAQLEDLLGSVTRSDESFAYAEGKWSIRELLGHVIDTERLFGYRALHFVRSDPNPLPGMEQDDWAAASNAGRRSLASLLAEFRALRTSTTLFFADLDDDELSRRGVASGCEFTVRSLAHIMAGHELHHRGVLRDRYLGGLSIGG